MARAEPAAAIAATPGAHVRRPARVPNPEELELRGRERATFRAMVALIHLLSLIPDFLLYPLGVAGGWIAWQLDRRHRRIGEKNLAIAFPERSDSERRAILRASYINLGRSASEYIRLGGFFRRRLLRRVSYDRYEYYEELMAQSPGRGIIVLSAHFGNFELLATSHAMFGNPIALVHHTQSFRAGDALTTFVRARAGVGTFRKHAAARSFLKTLRAGGVAGVAFDQNAKRGEALFVPFFGELAATTSGLARIALISDALVVPAFIVRQPDGRTHRIEICDAIPLVRSDDLARDLEDNTRAFLAPIEEAIRRHPEQFLWTHRRYRTRPRGTPPIYEG